MPVYPSIQQQSRINVNQHEENETIQSIVITEGESVTLRCKAPGQGDASVAWTKNENLLVPGEAL